MEGCWRGVRVDCGQRDTKLRRAPPVLYIKHRSIFISSFISSCSRKWWTKLLPAIPSFPVCSADKTQSAAKSRVRNQPLGGRTAPHSVTRSKKLISWYLQLSLYLKPGWPQTDARSLGLSRNFVGDWMANCEELLSLETTCSHQLCSLSFPAVDISYRMNTA